MTLDIRCLSVDSRDPVALAGFWPQALGWRRTHDTEVEVTLPRAARTTAWRRTCCCCACPTTGS